jgi:hypothetical protein
LRAGARPRSAPSSPFRRFAVFSRVDRAALEAALEAAINARAEQVLVALPGEAGVLAGDGKALRGSHARSGVATPAARRTPPCSPW